MKRLLPLFLLLIPAGNVRAENGYELWLRYLPVEPGMLNQYRSSVTRVYLPATSPALQAAREEMEMGLNGLLQIKTRFTDAITENGTVVAATASSPDIASLHLQAELSKTGTEGYLIAAKSVKGKKCIVITANTDAGVLYGVFHFLRLIQTRQSLARLQIIAAPKTKLRLLNHWDNLNRTVERGYAGLSIWNWHTLPGYLDKRYKDYARANASVGINGTVLTNVNANAIVLTTAYLQKVAALADVFRPYGIKVYLTARFSAPIEAGGLKTADPLDPAVQNWWKQKINEIYSLIPDFGGFLVKANSEGQPGPQAYGRSHADGANLLADAIAPYKGIVIWRAFVYSNENPDDRHKQAYTEFVPLDGSFRSNVMVQVKNGAIDFMPREPFHPLFGAMPKTPLMLELQITQEYLGQGTNLVFLAPLFKECLDSDTYAKGKGSTVAKITAGSLDHHSLNGIAGVANTGNELNWCGHPFAQANWYAFGRLTWDYDLSAASIAEEWIRMTFSNQPGFIQPVKQLMLSSRETAVRYMNPLGLHHLMGTGHHYGPAPWVSNLSRADWNPVYYHKADSTGLGFDRTHTGSNAISQYQPEVRKRWETLAACEEKYLLWFHHVPWTYKLQNGRTLWEVLCHHYYSGANQVKTMQQTWDSLDRFLDHERFRQVKMLLQLQYDEALWWRNACLLYFQTFHKIPLPPGYEGPDRTLDYYKQLRFPYAPGN